MPRIFNTIPSGRIRNASPSTRVSNFQTGHAGETRFNLRAGMLIGMLGLTYANDIYQALPYGDFRPNVRIANNF